MSIDHQRSPSNGLWRLSFDDVAERCEPDDRRRILSLQAQFTLIRVKLVLVSLLNGFRDLTLMGVQAFDFNHLNNVLISRDYKEARLIDIDGASRGSIQFIGRSGQYCAGTAEAAMVEVRTERRLGRSLKR